MRRALLPLVLLLPLAAPVMAETQPRLEMGGQPPKAGSLPTDPALPTPKITPRPPWWSKDRIVYAFDRPAKEWLSQDMALTKACQRGEFVQVVDMLYRAFGPSERPLGVAYGTMAINLYDPKRLRQVGTVYFFADQDSGRCRVWTARQDDIRDFFVGP
ncbi:MAG TPA: hypothetical protein VED40_13480 [Azospirillaceae bacterium]|nr:hypothetical protein [Azospirillaceae bacterium]